MSKRNAPMLPGVPSAPKASQVTGKAVLSMRLLAGGLASFFLGQAALYLFAGDLLAGFLGHHYDPHVYQELSLAYIAVSLGGFAGALRPDRMQAAIYTMVPLGLLLGGLGLVGLQHSESLASSAPHFVEAALAMGLLILWSRQEASEKA